MALSQSDTVSLRAAATRPLPKVWSTVIMESNQHLASRYEDQSVAVADESALQRREDRLRAADAIVAATTSTAKAAGVAASANLKERADKSSAHRRRTWSASMRDPVDAMGYYEYSDDEESGNGGEGDEPPRYVAIGAGRRARGDTSSVTAPLGLGTRSAPVDLFHAASPIRPAATPGRGAALAMGGRRTLLTPPSFALHATPMQPFGADAVGTARGSLREVPALQLTSRAPAFAHPLSTPPAPATDASMWGPLHVSSRNLNQSYQMHDGGERRGLFAPIRTREILPPPTL